MNVKWNDVQRRTTTTINTLKEVKADLDDALSRPDHKHGMKLAKLRRRVLDALIHLEDGIQ